MSIFLKYFLIAVVVVYIVDLSGFTQSWRGWLSRKLGGELRPLKPFDCSLCLTWWVLIIVSLCDHTFSAATLAYIALLSFAADIIGQALRLVKEAVRTAIAKLFNLLER